MSKKSAEFFENVFVTFGVTAVTFYVLCWLAGFSDWVGRLVDSPLWWFYGAFWMVCGVVTVWNWWRHGQ